MRSSSSGARKEPKKGGKRLNGRPLTRRKRSRLKGQPQVKPALGLLICLTHVVALSGCSGRSHGAQVPMAVTSSQADVLCGTRDDGLAHVPPRFNDFMPPNQGESYIDPQYGCTVVRLTDAKSQFRLSVHHQYSTISAVNQNDTRVMLITE